MIYTSVRQSNRQIVCISSIHSNENFIMKIKWQSKQCTTIWKSTQFIRELLNKTFFPLLWCHSDSHRFACYRSNFYMNNSYCIFMKIFTNNWWVLPHVNVHCYFVQHSCLNVKKSTVSAYENEIEILFTIKSWLKLW